MSDSIHGIIHGRTIMLSQDPGIADGQEVEVVVRRIGTKRLWGEGILRSAGAWAGDDEEFDEFLAEWRRSRNDSRPELTP